MNTRGSQPWRLACTGVCGRRAGVGRADAHVSVLGLHLSGDAF